MCSVFYTVLEWLPAHSREGCPSRPGGSNMCAFLARCAVLFFCLMPVFPLQASAQTPERGEVVMVDASYPPFMYGVDGKATGVYPAILAEAFARMGVPLEIQAVPWKRAIAAIDAGRAGVGGLYLTGERLGKYDYSEMIFTEVLLLFTVKGRSFAFTNMGALVGKRIGVLRGWSYGDAFDAARDIGVFTTEEVESDTQNFAKLLAGRLDAIVVERESANIILSSPEYHQKFEAVIQPLANNPAYLAFAKTAGKKDLLARFNAVLTQMKADGSYDAMVHTIFLAR